jgi:hypothetical protein
MAQSVNPSNDHYNMAKALSAALEPLIDVCLKIGITSPEMESLLRVAFVQRAFEKLPRHANSGRGPSDSRVGIARFTTSGGLPLDLPMERNKQRRSFEDLVGKYAPGNHAGTVLKELRRRGNVELLADEIIRFKSSTPRSKGVTPANVSQAAKRIKRLGETLFQNILEPEHARLYDETGKIELTAEQLALLRPVIERRAKTFLQALESEFGLPRAPEKGVEVKTAGVSVFSWQDD